MDPFHSLDDLQRELNRMFDNFPLTSPVKGEQTYIPAVDITEDDNQINVTADIPGMNKDEIDISIQDDVLTIKGHKEEKKEEKDKNYIRTERYAGSFNRSLALPGVVDADKVTAAYKDGTLRITLPKKEEAKQLEKKIKID